MEAIDKDIELFLSSGYDSGYGSGSGYGYGSGYGDGDGDGYGYGSGSGSGSGSGYGDGYGYGDGDGDGDGYGCGYGYGDGDGDGYGDGDGIREYCGRKVYYIDNVPTLIYSVRGGFAKGAAVNKDLTLTPCWVAKVRGFHAHGDTIHKAASAAAAKWEETRPLEERIENFVRSHPELDEPYGDLFECHHILTGSCEFGRRRWCEEHGHEPTDAITVREFLAGTADDYGGDVIRMVAERYGLNLGTYGSKG